MTSSHTKHAARSAWLYDPYRGISRHQTKLSATTDMVGADAASVALCSETLARMCDSIAGSGEVMRGGCRKGSINEQRPGRST